LTKAQYDQAETLVRAGHTPAAAVQAAASPSTPPTAKVKVSAAELGAYSELRRLGRTHAQAAKIIETQRMLAEKLGLPTSEAVRQLIAQRNATGRWPE
jgi:hypothetical protein